MVKLAARRLKSGNSSRTARQFSLNSGCCRPSQGSCLNVNELTRGAKTAHRSFCDTMVVISTTVRRQISLEVLPCRSMEEREVKRVGEWSLRSCLIDGPPADLRTASDHSLLQQRGNIIGWNDAAHASSASTIWRQYDNECNLVSHRHDAGLYFNQTDSADRHQARVARAVLVRNLPDHSHCFLAAGDPDRKMRG